VNKNESMTVNDETFRNGKLQQYILLQGLAHYEQFQVTWFEVFCSSLKHSISSHTIQKKKKTVARKYEGYPENKFGLRLLPLQRCGPESAHA
jgi:hypothetical protein